MKQGLKEKLMFVISTKDQWINLASEEIISDEELRKRIKNGELKSTNVSSKPKILPVFGDLEYDLQKFLNIYTSSENIEGYLKCHKNVKGPSNPGDSCFFDSALICMFLFRESPFYKNMIEKDIDNFNNLTCSSDSNIDRDIKIKIQQSLRQMYNANMIQGSNKNCTDLRKLIGTECVKNEKDLKFGTGMHEPLEFYQRILDLFDYKPVTISLYRYESDSPDSYSDYDLTSKQEMINWIGIGSVSNPFFNKIDINEEFSHKVAHNDIRNVYIHEVTEIHSADAVIYSIDRRNYERGDTSADTRRIGWESEVVLNGKIFKLHGVVLTVTSGGHYIALVKCDNKWLLYNDLRTTSVLETNVIEDRKAKEMISTQGVLFFYY